MNPSWISFWGGFWNGLSFGLAGWLLRRYRARLNREWAKGYWQGRKEAP